MKTCVISFWQRIIIPNTDILNAFVSWFGGLKRPGPNASLPP